MSGKSDARALPIAPKQPAPNAIDRRTAVKIAASLPIALAFGCTWTDVEQARTYAETAIGAGPYTPTFFDDAEWRTVRILSDLVIPADDRSPSATDARVPEFLDIIMTDRGGSASERMREGLAWLDEHSRTRFGAAFADATDAQRRAILDDIAWPDRAPAELADGVSFFNAFRDLTAAGFFSSPMGIADLEYTGNTYVAEWNGCPEPALRKLGVSYS